MKVKPHTLSSREKMRTLDALYTSAGALKGRDAMKHFLRDLLTESERIMLGRRILIAQMLLSGHNCEDIAQKLKVGYDTVYRVEHWLSDQMPGYENAVIEMNKEFEKREEQSRIGRMYADQTWAGVIARLKKKYPLHFLLVPWLSKHTPPSHPRSREYMRRRRISFK